MARPKATPEALAKRQAALTALTQHPSWPDLLDEVRKNEERIEQRVLAITLGSLGPVDSLEIARLRGFIRGMRWFTAVPSNAEAELDKYLRRRGVNLEGSNE